MSIRPGNSEVPSSNDTTLLAAKLFEELDVSDWPRNKPPMTDIISIIEPENIPLSRPTLGTLAEKCSPSSASDLCESTDSISTPPQFRTGPTSPGFASASAPLPSSLSSSLSSISSSSSFQPATSSPSSSFTSHLSFATDPASVEPQDSNVVFATEFFDVRPSAKGGLGAFACLEIPEDTVIHSEAPLFETTAMELYSQYENLSSEQMGEYFSLAFWRGVSSSRVMATFLTNRYRTSGELCGIFLKSSRFNHACAPVATCTYLWQAEEKLMVFRTVRSIKKGEEITVPYSSEPRSLYQNYGFRCDCSCC